jgi:hypothetical protein
MSSVPHGSEKRFLEIEEADGGFAIIADKADAEALAALFLAYGLSCRREPDVRPGQDALQFLDGVKREQVEQVLDGYRTAKGS